MDKATIQTKYEEFYQQAVEEATPNEVTIGIQADGETKLFKERNFYFCGFNNIIFKAKGKNRELAKFSRSKAYPSGFYLDVQSVGNRGNGDYELQQVAYGRLASWLNAQGYDVDLDSRLD